jgi:NTE family protein
MSKRGSTQPRVGLALGSGSARGWAHIGVLRALAERGVEPDIVCGTSVGALVGAAYVTDRLDALETWARSIRLLDFDRAEEIIAEGRSCLEAAWPAIERALEPTPRPVI